MFIRLTDLELKTLFAFTFRIAFTIYIVVGNLSNILNEVVTEIASLSTHYFVCV